MMKKKSNQGKYGTISLPLPLIVQIKKKIEGTGMHSVSAYVTFVLRQLFSSSDSNEMIDKDSENEIKRRLKVLGYE